jgi:hypothetical protein
MILKESYIIALFYVTKDIPAFVGLKNVCKFAMIVVRILSTSITAVDPSWIRSLINCVCMLAITSICK